MKIKKISVVVPVYNVEAYIERCISSLQHQTITDIEIVVVNDCTPDASMQIVEKLASEDDRIKVVEHLENKGLMRARQTGYKAATGDYITFCDSDDYLPEDALESLYEEAVKTDADIVSGNIQYLKTDGTSELWQSELNYGNDRHAAMKSLLLNELRHNLCGKLFKKSIMQDYDYLTYDHFTNAEDACLFYQIIININHIVQVDSIVYYYLQNSSSSSQVRYSDKGIKSICLANKIRHETASQFDDLKRERFRMITEILYSLFAQGYAITNSLNNYIKINGLQVYKTPDLHYFSIKELLVLLYQRVLLSIWTVIKYNLKRNGRTKV